MASTNPRIGPALPCMVPNLPMMLESRRLRCRGLALALALVSALLTPCFARTVKVFPGQNVDFTKYKTYQWLPTKALGKAGIVEDDPTLTPVIKAAVNRELTARGLKEVAEGGDLQVATCALNTSVPQLEALVFPLGMAFEFSQPIAAMGRYNKEGTLAISLIDSRTNKYAWAGLVTDTIDNKPGGGIGKIPKATEILFKKYPVKK